jgi:hypothetical protein
MQKSHTAFIKKIALAGHCTDANNNNLNQSDAQLPAAQYNNIKGARGCVWN